MREKRGFHVLAPIVIYFQPASVQMSSLFPSEALSATSSGRTRGSELHRLAMPKMPKHMHANQAFFVCS